MVSQVTSSVRDKAYLLRSIDYGESHRILNFLTSEHGRVDLMALGAKKSRKRFSGALDFLFCLSLEFQPGLGGGLGRLIQCNLEEDYPLVRGDYSCCVLSLEWLKLLSKVLSHGGAVPGLFSVLRDCLRALESSEGPWVDLVFRRWTLNAMGYQLELSRCVRCGITDAESFRFLPQSGGLLCPRCQTHPEGFLISRPFPQDIWALETKSSPLSEADLAVARTVLAAAIQEFFGVI